VKRKNAIDFALQLWFVSEKMHQLLYHTLSMLLSHCISLSLDCLLQKTGPDLLADI